MRKLIASSFMTLDGVGEDPASFEGTAFGGWSLPFFDEEMATSAYEQLLASDLFLCGRVTYEGFSKSGPAMSGPYAERLNSMPKVVASTSLREPLEWNATLLKSQAIERIRELKEQPGKDIVAYSGGGLLQVLLDAGLVDELKVQVFPLLLGEGEQLFRHPLQRGQLTHVASRPLSSGVVVVHYEPRR